MKDVSCIDHWSFVQNFTNAPVVVPDLPIGAILHQLCETWVALEVGLNVIRILGEGYTLPFQIPPHLTRTLTITSGSVHPPGTAT